MSPDTKVKVDQSATAEGAPVTVLRFTGDITSTSKEAVLGTFQKLPKDHHRDIILDFSNVEYLNSSGIGLIIQMLMEASKAGQRIQTFGLTPHFQKVFAMVGLTRFTTVHPSEAEAKAAFA